MKLGELFEVFSEYTSVEVLSAGIVIAVYNGKDSIPPRYNSCEVVKGSLRVRNNTVSVEVLAETAAPRYEALFGVNTKQFWLYDSEDDTYIDPPTDVLEAANAIAYKGGEATADSYEEAQAHLEKLANAIPEPDWLHDGNEYSAEEYDI